MTFNTSVTRRAAIYIRVSTQEQKVDGYGLESQKKRLREYITGNTALNLKEVAFFEDTHTGSDLNRPGFQALMEQVKQKKIDVVLVWKIDRLSRSLKHLLNTFEILKEQGVSFMSMQENIDFRGAIGGLIFQVFGAIAQFERELIKGRTQAGKIMSAELGNYTGSSIPYGYKPIKNASGKGKKLALVPEEKKWIEKMFHWYIYDGIGDMAIANKLNELNVPRGAHGKSKPTSKWTVHQIEHIIPNTIYRGEFVANRKDANGVLLPEEEWTVTKIPSCVSEFVFAQAQHVRSSRNHGITAEKSRYLLSGKLRDMTQNPPMAFAGKQRIDGKFSYYRKQNPSKGLSVFEVPAKQVEEYVWERILEAMKDPKVFVNEWLKREYVSETRISELEQIVDQLREERINRELKIARIEDFGERGVYDEEKMIQKLTEENGKTQDIEAKIDDYESQIHFLSGVELEIEKLKDVSKQFHHRLEHLTFQQKKTIVQLFVDRVEMYREPLPDSMQIGKRMKWRKTMRVVFRFNPEKFLLKTLKDRTGLTADKAKIGELNSQNGVSGEERSSGYYFSYYFDLEFYEHCFRDNRGYMVREMALREIPKEKQVSQLRSSDFNLPPQHSF